MSFDLGPINRNLSNVQASSKTTDGGGGNTGYFCRGQQEENKLNKAKDYPEDSFEIQGTLDEIQEQSFLDIIKNLFLDFFEAIKNFFIKPKEE